MFQYTKRPSAVGIDPLTDRRPARAVAGPRSENRWRVPLCAAALLVSLACVPPARGDQELTLQGGAPKIHFIDDAGDPRQWTLGADNLGVYLTDVNHPLGATTTVQIDPGSALLSLWIKPGPIPNDPRVGLGINGDIGANLQISAPVTQTIRMTQNEAPFYKWDLLANHQNWMVQDKSATTNPFVIAAGAPTAAIWVKSDGSIGLGTSTPDANSRLDIRSSLTNGLLAKRSDANAHYLRVENTVGTFRSGVQGNGDAQFGALTTGKGLNLLAGGTSKVTISSLGQINFGNPPPAFTTDALRHQTGARLTDVGVWANASSRDLKQDIEPITGEQARDTVRALQPVGYRYKSNPQEQYVGFIAEDVPDLVALQDRKSLAPMDIVGVLTKVVQDQDRLNDQQEQTMTQQQQTLARQQRLLAQQQETLAAQQAALAALTRRLADLEQRSAE